MKKTLFAALIAAVAMMTSCKEAANNQTEENGTVATEVVGDLAFVNTDLVFAESEIFKSEGMALKEFHAAVNPLSTLPLDLDFSEIENYVCTSGSSIIKRKGATFYGVASCVAYFCRRIVENIDTVMVASTILDGEYGIHDVALSLMCIINGSGVKTTLTPTLTEEELKKLHHSAEVLKNSISQLRF